MKLFVPLCLLAFSSTISFASAKPPIPYKDARQSEARSAKEGSFRQATAAETILGQHSIIVKKTKTSKSRKVALYPDTEQKVLFFNVRGFSGEVYQLFVFDMHGNIVKQAEIRNKQTTFIKDMDKGSYLFEVFSNDDRIGEGQITVQ